MHWQEACLKSPNNKACRQTDDGRTIFRTWDGHAIIATRAGGEFREAFPAEIEGLLDWWPA